MRIELEVEVWRGDILESRHEIEAAACDADGTPMLETPDAGLVTTFRSAAKPLQLLPLVERGHADRWGFSDEELAVMAASHVASDDHIRLVSGVLARIGLGPEHLACGYHEPFDAEMRRRLIATNAPPSPLYNNCSGKHAGMLCLAISEGWEVAGYERAEHPLQRLMRRTIAELSGVPEDAIGIAVDGCSVPVFALPLRAMARAFARLAVASDRGDVRARALARIRRAMGSFPRATGGAGRFSTELMEATSGRLLAKGGAEGLECVALPRERLGLALKCRDGNDRGVAPAVIAALEALEALDPDERTRLEARRHPVLQNHAGLRVGRLEVKLRQAAPAT